MNQLFQEGDVVGKYVIESTIKPGTRNSVYKAYIQGSEEKDNYYIIKAMPYQTKEEVDYFNATEEILNQFSKDKCVISHLENIRYEILNKTEDEEGNIKEEKETFMCIVMTLIKYYQIYDLKDYFDKLHTEARRPKNMKADKIRSIFYKVLKIVKKVHDKSVVHKDIKPNNFLVRNIDPLDIVLTDFELSVKLNPSQKNSEVCGTPKFMAPEVLKGKDHDFAVDIWALGMMMHHFVAWKFPFNIMPDDQNQDSILRKIEKNSNVFYLKNVDPNLADLIKKMLEIDPTKRITAADALKHPYFENYVDIESETKEQVSVIESEIKNTDLF